MTTRAFLADFGLARLADTGSRLTRTGHAIGTPAYMSPEAARGESTTLAPTADIWSLGCVLYECLAGRRAFEGDTPAEVIGRVLTAEPPDPRVIRPDLPAGVALVLGTALAKSARARQPTAGGLRDDLARVLAGERPRWRVARRPGPRALAVAGLSAIAAVGLGVIAWPGADEPPAAATPSEAEALARRARALRGGDPRQAETLLHRALELAPAREDWRLERGLLLWAIGEGPSARRLWSELPAGSPGAIEGRLYLGLETLFRDERGRRDLDAEPHLRAVAAAPGRVGRLGRAALAAVEKRWPQVREALRHEAGWEAALLRAYAADRHAPGALELANRDYTEALDGGPPLAWAFNNRGSLRRELGDVSGAIEDFGRAVAVNPGLGLAWFNRGVARKAQGDLAGAIEDYDRAVEADPTHTSAWHNRGLARAARGDPRGAIQDYERVLEIDPGFAEAWSSRGNVRRELGDLTGAIDDYGRALQIDPTRAKAWNNRGGARHSRGDLSGAIEDYGRALELDPNYPGTWCNRASARNGLGDLAGAAADLEQALAVAPAEWPGRPTTELNLSRIRAALDMARGEAPAPGR